MQLTHKLVQPFIEMLEEAIPYQMTITDVNGYIIGTSDPTRLNRFHASAYEIIHGRQPVESLGENGEWEVPDGVKLGYGEKLIYEGECIGLIGLVGPPEELKMYVRVAKLMLNLLLERNRVQEELQLAATAKNTFIAKLLLGDSKVDDRSEERGKLYQIDLTLPRTVIVMEPDFGSVNEEDPLAISKLRQNLFNLVQEVFPRKEDMLCELDTGKIAVLSASENHADQERRKKIIEKAVQRLASQTERRFSVQLLIGVSQECRSYTQYHDCYKQAITALTIGRRTKDVHGIYYFDDMMVGRIVYGMDKRSVAMLKERILDKLVDIDENTLIHTLLVYFNHNLKIEETAKQLFIHRNTLQNRFRRIKELTGLDVRKSDDLTLLRLAMMQYQFS